MAASAWNKCLPGGTYVDRATDRATDPKSVPPELMKPFKNEGLVDSGGLLLATDRATDRAIM